MNSKTYDKIKHTDEEIDEELLSALINAGAHEYIKSEISMPSEEEISKVSFSDEFEERMKHQLEIFEESNKKNKRSKLLYKTKNIAIKVAASFFLTIALMSVFVATSKAVQYRFMKVFIEVFNIKTDFDFGKSADTTQNSTSLADKLNYIPMGLTVTNEENYDLIHVIKLESEEGNSIEIIRQRDGALTVDTEKAKTYEKIIGNYNCFISEKEDTVTIVFSEEDYVYTVISNLNMEETTKIVENIR